MQYGGGIFSMMEGVQYGEGTSSVRTRVCNMDQAHYQYRGGTSSVWGRCAEWMCHMHHY